MLVPGRQRVVAYDEDRFGKEFEVDQQLRDRARRRNLELATRIPQQHLHNAAPTSGPRSLLSSRDRPGLRICACLIATRVPAGAADLLPAPLLDRRCRDDLELVAGYDTRA